MRQNWLFTTRDFRRGIVKFTPDQEERFRKAVEPMLIAGAKRILAQEQQAKQAAAQVAASK